MADFMILLVLFFLVGGAVFYIIKAKKRGVKCIGCPAAGECAHKNKCAANGGCGCHVQMEQ